ncbi:MAG: hypothetical protein ABSG10_10020 [Terracidiphilus sp.]|jgi:uncharacterized membrane protein YdcZ (DUF606 family)
MATAAERLLKSLKVALIGFVVGYFGFVAYFVCCLIFFSDKHPEIAETPIILWAIPPGIIAAIIAFAATFFLTGRNAEPPPSLTK